MRRVRVESAAGVLVSATVIGIGAAAGFTHTHDAAVAAGQSGGLAWADAVVIELLVVAAGFQVHRRRQAGQSARFALGVVVAAFLVQMGAQVALAPRTLPGWLFAAMPALGCLVVIKLASRPVPAVAADCGVSASSVVRDAVPVVDVVPVELEPARVQGAPVEPVVAAWPPR